MSSKKKIAAIVITTVALTASTVGIASASSKSTSTRVSISNPGALGNKGPRGLDLNATLSALVAKGTITQAQADAIVAAANAARVAAEALRPLKPAKVDKDARLALISTTIGIDSATVKTRLAAGETLAAIAGAKKDALIAALVADETKRIDAAVTAGKLTAAQATTLKAGLVAHVTNEVNQVRPVGPRGEMDSRKGKNGKGEKGGMGGRGHGPMGAAPTIPAPTASSLANA
jgi:Spy/CpxP family protein refolding chaperone